MPINETYRTWIRRICELRPKQRKTQVQNFVWLLVGIFHSHSVKSEQDRRQGDQYSQEREYGQTLEPLSGKCSRGCTQLVSLNSQRLATVPVPRDR